MKRLFSLVLPWLFAFAPFAGPAFAHDVNCADFPSLREAADHHASDPQGHAHFDSDADEIVCEDHNYPADQDGLDPSGQPPSEIWLTPGPVPRSAGAVELALRDPAGGPGTGWQVKVHVQAPDGWTYVAPRPGDLELVHTADGDVEWVQIRENAIVRGADWLTVRYPDDFHGAPALEPGVYTVTWYVAGGSEVVTGFEVAPD